MIAWQPSAYVRRKLKAPNLLNRDRVEIVIRAYARAHGGNSPSLAKIATILGDSKGNIHRYVNELIALKRATRQDGELWLLPRKRLLKLAA